MAEDGERLLIEPAVLTALGVTLAEVGAMGVRAFWELATDRGFDVNLSFREPFPPRRGHLSITVDATTIQGERE